MGNFRAILFLVALCLSASMVMTQSVAEEEDIQNLCPSSVDSTRCLREFFRRFGRCIVVRNPNDGPIRLKERRKTYVPTYNTTLDMDDIVFKNMNGKIDKFYLNKKTNNIVLSVHFDKARIETNATFIINQRGKEPKKVTEKASGTHVLEIVAVIPETYVITTKVLDEAYITAYLPQPSVEMSLGPKIEESTDPVIAAVAKGFHNDGPTVSSELFFAGAKYFFQAYLQKYICKFNYPFEEVSAYGNNFL